MVASIVPRDSSCCSKFCVAVTNFAKQLYEEDSEPVEMQQRCDGVLRTCAEMVAMISSPKTAIVSGIIAGLFPERVEAVVSPLDEKITMLWESVSFKKKVLVIGVAIPLAMVGLNVLNLPGISYVGWGLAMKLGADFGLRDYRASVAAEARSRSRYALLFGAGPRG
jgi:hypothetical protein